MAALAWSIRMPLAERRRQTVHRRRLVPAVFAIEVLRRWRGEQRDCGGTQCPREQKLHTSLHCFSFFRCLFRSAALSPKRKGGAACVSCRGDWYAQGDHARDAAKHATTADGAGLPTPIPQPRHFGTAVLCCASPYRTITSLSTGYGGYYTTIPLKHTSRHTSIRMTAGKCDSGISANRLLERSDHAADA